MTMKNLHSTCDRFAFEVSFVRLHDYEFYTHHINSKTVTHYDMSLFFLKLPTCIRRTSLRGDQSVICRKCIILDPTIRKITLLGDQPLPGNLLNARNCLVINRVCDNVRSSPFRTFDGSCNNLVRGRENFGSIERAFRRRLAPRFGDRKSSTTFNIHMQ